MSLDNQKLTFFEAATIISGFGIGGGIMTVPYLVTKTGIPLMLILMFVGLGVSLLLHLIIAEIMLRDEESNQLVEIMQKYLLQGKLAFLTWALFGVVIFSLFSLSAAYIAGGGKVIASLLDISSFGGFIIFYLLSTSVVFFGLKAIGISEKYGVLGIIALVIVFAIGCFQTTFSIDFGIYGSFKESLALFGMIMFCFLSIFSVPQVTSGLSWNKRLIPRAIATGIGINGIITLAIVFMSLGVSTTVDEIAILSLGKALGDWAYLIGSLFILIAMFTSYWSISFALAVIVQERVGWSYKISWFLATVPGIILVLMITESFLRLLQMAGGTVALLIAVMIFPLFARVKKQGKQKSPEWSMGWWGNYFFQFIVLVAFVAMTLGTLIS